MHFCGTLETEEQCHSIIRPRAYRGPETEERGNKGRSMNASSESFRLGPRVVFKSSEPGVAE